MNGFFVVAEPFKLTRIPTLKTVADFHAHVRSLGIELPCEEAICTRESSPLCQPVSSAINGKQIGNRWAIQPMEGWDGTTTGGPTDEVRRRWQRFRPIDAKLTYCGGRASRRPE